MRSLYLYLTVVDALSRNQLTLPTLPEVALRVRRACQDPAVSLARLAREIASDPATTARLLRVANSAAYGGRPLDNLPQAITRLGLPLTRTLVDRFALEQLYVAQTPALAQCLRESWARSLEVAAIAAALARSRTQLNPATAMLAGLLREIGVLPLIRLADAQPDLIESSAALDEVVQRLQMRAGAHLLRAWNFPAELAEIPITSADTARQHDGPPDYADVVCVAALYERRSRAGLLARLVRTYVPALDKLGLPTRFDPRRADEALVQLAAERQLLAA